MLLLLPPLLFVAPILLEDVALPLLVRLLPFVVDICEMLLPLEPLLECALLGECASSLLLLLLLFRLFV